MSKWENGKMGKWENGKMGKWENKVARKTKILCSHMPVMPHLPYINSQYATTVH